MKKISKMVYEAPFIEVIHVHDERLMAKLSGVDYGDGNGQNPIGDHDPGGMGKEFGFEEYDSSFAFESWNIDWE